VANSATIRAVLALRNVVYSNGGKVAELALRFQPNLRVVVQIEKACAFLGHADFVGLDGTSCLYIQVRDCALADGWIARYLLNGPYLSLSLSLSLLLPYCGKRSHAGLSSVL
jgi:hypothetical protein